MALACRPERLIHQVCFTYRNHLTKQQQQNKLISYMIPHTQVLVTERANNKSKTTIDATNNYTLSHIHHLQSITKHRLISVTSL